MEQSRQALYSVEQGGKTHFFKAPSECSVEDLLKNASLDNLMKLGEEIDRATYLAIEKSEKNTFSVDLNFDTDRAIVGIVNDGRGGLTIAERNDPDYPGEYVYEVEISKERQRLKAKSEKKAENIPQTQDISHKTANAVPTATRGESRGKVMEQNTKFEVSTMSKLEGDGPAKAIATLVVNGEFAVHGVKVVEGGNGLYTAMPSEKQGNGEYKDVVFPVTSEARAAIENAVLDTYGKLSASLEKSIKNDVAVPEKPVSKVYAQMHEVKSDSTQTKAAGQLTIDSCLVVTGVKLNEGTNAQGQTKNFVAMPARMNANGTYDDVAHPITADFHNKVDKAVIASANNIGRYEYKGVKYAELGENPVSSKPLHPKFADKLMNELDKAGIPYQAKCGERTTITVAAGDNQKFETVKKELTEKLNAKDKPKQTQEQKQTTGTRSTH